MDWIFFLVPVVFLMECVAFFFLLFLLKWGAFQSVELSFSAACVQELVSRARKAAYHLRGVGVGESPELLRPVLGGVAARKNQHSPFVAL